jgi:hypothetical protein
MPRRHGALVRLCDGESALVVALPLLVGDNAWWGRQQLHLGGKGHVVEVHVVARTIEPPRHRVVGARGLLHRLEHAESDALASGMDLGVEVGRRPEAHAAVAGGAMALMYVDGGGGRELGAALWRWETVARRQRCVTVRVCLRCVLYRALEQAP